MAIEVKPNIDWNKNDFLCDLFDNFDEHKLPKGELLVFISDLVDMFAKDLQDDNLKRGSHLVEYIEFLKDTYMRSKNEA